MLALIWLRGLVRRRSLRLLGAAVAVACAVALLSSLGAFLAAAKADMTRHAVADVGVDWQVEAQRGADPNAVLEATTRAAHVQTALPVSFGTTNGLSATIAGATQTTGAGQVLGVPDGYFATFPETVRYLVGAHDGVLLAQQTAANLHASAGDVVTIERPGLSAVSVRVDGVIDLPQADSLFQRVGAPSGAQPQAPPDNVVVLPASRWHTLFGPVASARPELVRFQAHARLDHRLPHDPAAAYTRVTGQARHLEAATSGAGLVGDNLAATLGAARSDALYAQILFVLLGVPGAVLAGMLTYAVASSGAARRRREYGLLRARGASLLMLQRIGLVEALSIAVLGSAVGIGAGALVGRVEFGSATFGGTPAAALAWAGIAVAVGLAISLVAVALPARRDARRLTVAASRLTVADDTPPSARRWLVDAGLLGGALLVFWLTSRRGYSLVLAPEGVPTVSVDYWALSGPILLWLGAARLGWHCIETLMRRGGRVVRAGLKPLAGSLTGPIVSTLRRQRLALTSAIVLVALAVAFAISTSVFDSTYSQQVGVDALLSNGADVTVTVPGSGNAAVQVNTISHIAGVHRVEPVHHQFAYVGADLQDIYGVNPVTVAGATRLQDAYFSGGTAHDLMRTLARQPDAALFSAETVKDFQLHRGDQLHLRVRDGRGALHDVTFHFAGVVKEFPTAPRDSFIVANDAYLASATGDRAPNVFLVSTSGARPKVVAERVARVVGTAGQVTDLDTSRHVVGSSLTAVDLRALTRVELGYALVLAAAAGGLVFALGLAERRRSFAITAALGARPRQLGAFVRAEALVVAIGGVVTGVIAGAALGAMLVKVLTGVFDPPPSQLSVPWAYLAGTLLVAVAAIAIAGESALRAARRPPTEVLRDL